MKQKGGKKWGGGEESKSRFSQEEEEKVLGRFIHKKEKKTFGWGW